MVGVERPWEEEPNHVALAHLHVMALVVVISMCTGCQIASTLAASVTSKKREGEREGKRERERERLNQQNKMYNINTA